MEWLKISFTNLSLGLIVSGRYLKAGEITYKLMYYKVKSRHNGVWTQEDPWKPIHGNQRKDIGCLKLLITKADVERYQSSNLLVIVNEL